MKEVPDRIVSLFLILAIASTVGGFITILYTVGGDFSLITGFATTGTGTVQVTVSGASAITLTNSNVNFGTGALTFAPAATPVNTSVAENPSTFDEPFQIIVQNDGNTELNITINGTPAANWLISGSSYEWAGVATGEGGCPAANLTTTRTPFSATMTRLCGNLTYADGADTVNISIFLNLTTQLAAATYTDNSVLIKAEAHS